MKRPSQPIRCLLLNTAFSEHSYWNYKISCEIIGRKAPSAPLGLITVAAILPQHWQFRLLDLNAQPFDQSTWDWAELVCIGGMLPQQAGMLEYVAKAKRDGKIVVVGGADPTSQPNVYREADAQVLGEGEITIPMWIAAWEKTGDPSGQFCSSDKPDVKETPVPRYDVLDFKLYHHVGVQYSRGCPFNCEFCDIIELFGRKPRTKAPAQFLNELDRLYELGYRGSVELVDDNFIGNKRFVKRDLLPALIMWQRRHRYPFYFNTEASMNLGDDKKLLRQMRAADFRYVFLGVESPDPEILMQTQKSQNTMGDIVTRIRTINEYGIAVLGGFIMGFDGEKRHTDKSMIRVIEESNICGATVGLLVALPTTQLTRRLQAEGRLIDFQGNMVSQSDGSGDHSVANSSVFSVIDHTNMGLNFITKRDRTEILEEYANVIRTIYSPSVYFARVYRMVKSTKARYHHWPSAMEFLRQLRAMYRLAKISYQRGFLTEFVRLVCGCARFGYFRFELAMRMVGLYMHFHKQSQHVVSNIKHQIATGHEINDRVARYKLEIEMKKASASAQPKQLDLAQSLSFASNSSW